MKVDNNGHAALRLLTLDVIRLINRGRQALGLEPLTDVPHETLTRGLTRCRTCPIAQAFTRPAHPVRSFYPSVGRTTMDFTANPFDYTPDVEPVEILAQAWSTTVVNQGISVRLPESICTWIAMYDAGKLPQYHA